MNDPGTCGDVNQSSSYLIDPQCFHLVPLASCYLCKLSVNTSTEFFDFVNRFKNNNHLKCNLNSLNIFYQNVRGLNTKLINFRSSIPLFICYDVIILTETWLSSDVHDSELGLNGYQIFRVDRNYLNSNYSRGGGVLIAIKSYIKTSLICTNFNTLEQIYTLLFINSFKILIGAVYLSPMSTLPDFEAHTSSIEHLISSTNPTSILLCGDYNLPLIKWPKSNQGLFASGTMSNTSTNLVDSFSYYNFYQLNQVPNARGCLLDLVFSSFDTPTVQLANTPIVSPDSYHPSLFVSFPFPTPITAQDTHKYRDYKSADYKSMLRYLGSLDWENTFSLYSIDDSAVVFNDALLSSINKFVPIKVFSPSKFPKWTSTILKNLIITKKKAHAVYKRTKSISDYLVFSEYRAKCKRQSEVDYSTHIRHTEEALSSSPSKFWNFVNNLKQKPPIPSSLHLGNIASNTPTESANLFSTHFSSMFNSSAFQLLSDYLSYELPSDITFTVDDVFFRS